MSSARPLPPLSEPVVPPIWRDPVLGIEVPKEEHHNLAYRHLLMEKARDNRQLQEQLLAMCARSVLFWINVFGWTFRQKEIGAKGETLQLQGARARRPFITWTRQDEVVLDIERGINDGHDILLDKSRDEGATWMVEWVFLHQWLFLEDITFLMLSRKEEEVDKPGNPKSLFWKLDYAFLNCPEWMRPRYVRTHMHLENIDRRNVVDGESTNTAAGKGDRRRAIFADEFAEAPEGFAIYANTADVSNCRIWNSTPAGPGTCFTWLHHQALRTGIPKRLELGWWSNPAKARGLAWKRDNNTGEVKRTSPWYESECARRGQNRQDIARNLDIDHGRAGDSFFDSLHVTRQLEAYALPAKATAKTGKIIYEALEGDLKRVDDRLRVQDRTGLLFSEDKQGEWTLWIPLVHGRPLQHTRYVLGGDVGNGLGASNSVLSVGDREQGRKVAEFASAAFKPYEFARICLAAALWFGGNDALPLIVWEANGPGLEFGDELVRLGYPRLYFMHQENTLAHSRTETYGWHSNSARKERCVGRYRQAMAVDDFVNPSVPALEEAGEYVYFENGSIGPARLREEAEGARATHGDRVIADTCLWMGMEEDSRYQSRPRQAPPGSPAWRRDQRKKRDRRRQETYWD